MRFVALQGSIQHRVQTPKPFSTIITNLNVAAKWVNRHVLCVISVEVYWFEAGCFLLDFGVK